MLRGSSGERDLDERSVVKTRVMTQFPALSAACLPLAEQFRIARAGGISIEAERVRVTQVVEVEDRAAPLIGAIQERAVRLRHPNSTTAEGGDDPEDLSAVGS